MTTRINLIFYFIYYQINGREKNLKRIPVKLGDKEVGYADISGILHGNKIYAHITITDGKTLELLNIDLNANKKPIKISINKS